MLLLKFGQKLAVERSRLLFKAAEKRGKSCRDRYDLSQRTGKAIKDAEKEIIGAADCLEYYACLGVNILGEFHPKCFEFAKYCPSATNRSCVCGCCLELSG